jgi:hypothetical protein
MIGIGRVIAALAALVGLLAAGLLLNRVTLTPPASHPAPAAAVAASGVTGRVVLNGLGMT